VEHTVRYAEAIGEEIELLSLPRILKLGGDIAITGIMVRHSFLADRIDDKMYDGNRTFQKFHSIKMIQAK
jgi:hypothetical protein